MTKLIIVESPTKAKTITRFLKGKYSVIASKGHIRDLPKSSIGVDVKNNFEPEYVIPERAEKNVADLKKRAKAADEILLATDEDREGEAISYHIAWVLNENSKSKKTNSKQRETDIKKYKRIVFHEITKDALENAIKNPRTVNMDLVDAQQARRVLDRLVGYKLSPVLWKKIRFGLSAGRVQSVALRLVVQKERERDAFKIEDYFLINGQFDINKSSISAILESISGKKLVVKGKNKQTFLITTKEEAQKVCTDAKTKDYLVDNIKQTEKNRKPYPPFTTSLLQQAASNIAGYSAQKTMRAAQKLYENGLITYHRTDSFNLSQKFVKQAEGFITKNLGADYYEPHFFKNKSKNAQEAHEAIRPTSLKNLPKNIDLGSDERVIYDLIFARALAVFMPPIKTLVTTINIVSTDKKYTFKTTGSKVLFEGWNKAYSFKSSIKYTPLSEDVILPELKENDVAKVKSVESEHKQTTPPARFSEASLIKTLEKYGIGRPSTYAPTISTIISRGYVVKENKALVPTDLGKVVTKLLEDNFKNIVDYNFTANIEEDLDKVAEGKVQWQSLLKDFYKPFEKEVNEASENLKRKDYTVLSEAPKNIKCPDCGGKMVVKIGRAGRFYSCAKFPDCKGIRDINGQTEADVAKKANSKDFKAKYKKAPKTTDGKDYILKRGRFGEFWAHPDYPKVKDAKPLELKKSELVKEYGEVPKTKDGRDFVLKRGRFGNFWAHPDYPKVKETIRIKTKAKKNPKS